MKSNRRSQEFIDCIQRIFSPGAGGIITGVNCSIRLVIRSNSIALTAHLWLHLGNSTPSERENTAPVLQFCRSGGGLTNQIRHSYYAKSLGQNPN